MTPGAADQEPGQDFRLDPTIRPSFYDAQVDLFTDEARTAGSIDISIQSSQRFSTLRLHAVRLDVKSASLDGRRSAAWTLEEASQTLRLDFSTEIEPGEHMLRIVYSGQFSSDMYGLYWAGDAVITQLESAYARRVFPCFDEPAYKARWKLAVSVEHGLKVLSNGHPEKETLDEVGGRRTVQFSTTRPMPSYLVAIAAGPFQSSEALAADGVQIRTWSTADGADLYDFAQEAALFSLTYEADYFDVPYQFGKLDQLAVKQFQFGAMENAGLVVYNEPDLLIDPGKTSLAGKKRVAEVIAHENAHQWFGNFVTMKWWDDLWLNESFATWLALKVVAAWKPDWNIWQTSELFRRAALEVDALNCTHAIRADVRSVQESDERFRQITYYKGGAVLLMIERYLGEEVFRDGMRLYMRRHGDSNAAARDLWDALAEVSGQPVREVAEEWVNREGFPVVDVALDGSRLLLQQKRFKARGPVEERPWAVPMVLRYVDDAGEHTERFLLDDSAATVELVVEGRVHLVCANVAASGFYRVSYSDQLDGLILDQTELLRPVERVAHLADLWALTVAGSLSVRRFLDAVSRLADEREEAVLAEAAGRLAYLSTRVLDAEGLKELASFACEVFGPAFDSVGWDASPEERDSSRQRRAELLRLVGLVGRSPEVAQEAARRVDEYLVTETNHLEPNLLDTATLLAARAADADRFQALVRGSQEARDPQGRRRYRSALAAVEDRDLQGDALGLALTDTVPGPDLFRFFSVAFANPETRDAAWRFYSEHWNELSARTGGMSMLGYLVEFLQSLGGDYARPVRDFFADVRVPTAEKVLAQTIEVLGIDEEFARRARPEAIAWLRERHVGRS